MRSQFTAGQVIFEKGETANRFYLIESGRVALESSTLGEVVRIDEVGAGDLLGWSWIFPPYVWHFDARAIEVPHLLIHDLLGGLSDSDAQAHDGVAVNASYALNGADA